LIIGDELAKIINEKLDGKMKDCPVPGPHPASFPRLLRSHTRDGRGGLICNSYGNTNSLLRYYSKFNHQGHYTIFAHLIGTYVRIRTAKNLISFKTKKGLAYL